MKCTCHSEGYCDRYRKTMTRRQVFLCKSSAKYRSLFDRIAADDAKPDDMPPCHRRLWSFLKSIVNVAMNRFAIVPKDVRESRLSICSSCPQNKNKWCRTCGCYLPIKVLFPSEVCPKYKWWSSGSVATINPVTGQLEVTKKGCGCGAPKS